MEKNPSSVFYLPNTRPVEHAPEGQDAKVIPLFGGRADHVTGTADVPVYGGSITPEHLAEARVILAAELGTDNYTGKEVMKVAGELSKADRDADTNPK